MTLFEYLNQEFDILPLETDLIEIHRICNSELEAVKAERDELKAMIEKHQKLQQGMLDALTQAEKERDELREFIIKLWIDSGFLEDTIERLQGKAQQLLTPKE